jgi:hypothetical protein
MGDNRKMGGIRDSLNSRKRPPRRVYSPPVPAHSQSNFCRVQVKTSFSSVIECLKAMEINVFHNKMTLKSVKKCLLDNQRCYFKKKIISLL